MAKVYIVCRINQSLGYNSEIVYISLDKKKAQSYLDYITMLEESSFVHHYLEVYNLALEG